MEEQAPNNNPIISEPNPNLYMPPKTSLFLEATDINGGSVNVPESNSGVLSS